jgi:POT family proton-dependent oligopeptide transporter
MKQPKALTLLFFVEMWERFSFYGMRGLLIYFMVAGIEKGGLGYEENISYDIKGAYGAILYISPLIGGLLADKILGYKKGIILGAFIMALGHMVMLVHDESTFFLGLALVALGTGYFKPNMVSTLGSLYSENDPRRDVGFTIFHMGVNLGAFLMFIPIFVGQKYDWHLGFSLAGFAMALGLITFMVSQKKYLDGKGESPNPELLHKKYLGPITTYHIIIILSILTLPLYSFLLKNKWILDTFILYPTGIVFIGYMIYQATVRESKESKRIVVYLILFFFSMMFWAFFEQGDTSLGLFVDKNLNKNVFGYELPAGVFQSLNSFYIIVFAPIVSLLWQYLERRGKDLSTPLKMGIGVSLNGVCFLIFATSVYFADTQGIVPLYFYLLAYMAITIGELCLYPTSLSLVTKIAPKGLTGFMMGGWMLSIAFSHSVASLIAHTTTGAHGESLFGMEALINYCLVYKNIGLIALFAGIGLALFSKPLAKMMALGKSEPIDLEK